jgi:hypothetical protein
MYIKDFFKFPFIFYIAIVVSLYYSSLYIMVLYSFNICLARDLFSSLEADLKYIKGFIYLDVVWEVYYNYPLIYYKYRVQAVPFIIIIFFGSICLYIF